MNSKKPGILLMKLAWFINYFFSVKKTELCLPLPQRFEKTFAHDSKYEYICSQLKYHQHRIRGKAGISLEMILNVFKCIIVSLVPLTCFGNSTIFIYFN